MDRAVVRIEGDLGGKGRYVEVTVDGKPLHVRSASLELTADRRHEVVLRIPAEVCDLDLKSESVLHRTSVPSVAVPAPAAPRGAPPG